MDSFKSKIEGEDVMLAVVGGEGKVDRREVRRVKREGDALRQARRVDEKKWGSKERCSPECNWPRKGVCNSSLTVTSVTVAVASSPVSTTALHTQ